MGKSNTKDRILIEALNLFSQKGFDAVSVDDIAKAVGIKAPSIYKHYKSKKDIFDGILHKMEAEYLEKTLSLDMHIDQGSVDKGKYSVLNTDSLIKEVKELVTYSLHDPFLLKFKKLMTIEQFRSKELSSLYTERYEMRILRYHEKLFASLMKNGCLKEGNPRSVAWQYVSPVITMMSICIREPEKEAELMKELEDHIRQFVAVYQIER